MSNEAMFNEDFGRWYRSLDLGSDPQTYEKRRAGTAALAKQVTREDVEALVRVAFKSRHVPASEALARLRHPLKGADDGFPMQGNDRELQIISAAALAELLRGDGGASPAAALAASTAAVGGLRRPELPLDLAEAAEASLATQCEKTRARPDMAKLAAPDFPKADFEKSAAKVQGQQDWNGVIAAFGLVTEASRLAHESLWKRCSGALATAGSYIAIQDEELNMLWWLIGERSADLDRPFAKVPAPERTLVLAKELAELTAFLPGPPAVKSLLARACVNEQDEHTIAECVNACDDDWLHPLVEGAEPSPVTRPLHFAIRRRIEAGDKISWVAAWAATTGLDAAKKLSGLQIAVLFYRERLLARWRIGS
jgi:hypothetical protein